MKNLDLLLGLHLTLTSPSVLDSAERDKEVKELHFSFVASISAVSSMCDISYHMIFRMIMIWIFRGASVTLLDGLMAYCHVLVFVLLKS